MYLKHIYHWQALCFYRLLNLICHEGKNASVANGDNAEYDVSLESF